MPKFSAIQLSKTEDKKGYAFNCPGCKTAHHVQTNPNFRPCWSFNEDLDNPTVYPSVRVKPGRGGLCHSFIEGGNIRFLEDCTHDLKNKTVELPEW